MSQELINHSQDLKKLQEKGYEIEICTGYLLIHNIPFVNCEKMIEYGTLVSALSLSGNTTMKPNTHVALWIGSHPCYSDGSLLIRLVNGTGTVSIREGLTTNFSFSQKPPKGYYVDYYHKMTSYVNILQNEARVIDPNVTAMTFAPVLNNNEKSVFCYMDTASSRAGITYINEKLAKNSIAIIGLGGTGSYILDLIAKTPVGEIHLYDGDRFLQHNAFRSPGAPSLNDLRNNTTKVAWFTEIYSKMRKKITPHPKFIDESNIAELNSMDVVFLCIDNGQSRQIIVNHLVKNKIPFIDTGIGINNENETLSGLIRITTCTPTFNKHIHRIPFNNVKDDAYSNNIQIADMNALNATLAVIKWKKMCGFYADHKHEHNTVYGIGTNIMTSDEMEDGPKYD